MLRVNGGPAGSGTKILRERGGEWTCKNGHVCAAYHANCLAAGCHEKRP